MTKKKKEPPVKELMQKPTTARKLNKEVIELVKKYLKIGVPIVEICKAINVSKETFYRWKKQGEIDKKNGINSLECDLCDSIIELQNFALIFHLNNIQKIANEGNLNASIFYLRVRFPEYFSDNPELRKSKKQKSKTVDADVDDIINRLNEKL